MTDHLILAVDHNRHNLELLAQFLKQSGYRTVGVSSLAALDRILAEELDIGLALVDLSGFDRSVWERCQQLSERGIPLLVIAPRETPAVRQEGFSHGARSVLTKPLAARDLIGIIQRLMED